MVMGDDRTAVRFNRLNPRPGLGASQHLPSPAPHHHHDALQRQKKRRLCRWSGFTKSCRGCTNKSAVLLSLCAIQPGNTPGKVVALHSQGVERKHRRLSHTKYSGRPAVFSFHRMRQPEGYLRTIYRCLMPVTRHPEERRSNQPKRWPLDCARLQCFWCASVHDSF